MNDSFSKPIKSVNVKKGVLPSKPMWARKADDPNRMVCRKCRQPIDGKMTVIFGEGSEPNEYECKACRNPTPRPSSTFPFTTTHFDGKPREVSSLHHLRKLEGEFGVRCAAYEMDEKNMADVPHYGKDQIKGSELRGHRGAAPQELRESIEVR